MAFDADIDVVTYLQANVVTSPLVVGTSIFYGPVRPVDAGIVDALSVFVMPFSGPPPERFLSCTTAVYPSELQVWIRGAKTAYRQALTLAREIRDLLTSDGPSVIAGYLDVSVVESEPFYQGEDDQGYPQFTLNVQATRDD